MLQQKENMQLVICLVIGKKNSKKLYNAGKIGYKLHSIHYELHMYILCWPFVLFLQQREKLKHLTQMGVGLWVSRHITPRYFKQNNPNEITNFTTLSYLFSFSLLHRHYIVLVKYIKIHISMKVKPIQVVYARKFDSICKI